MQQSNHYQRIVVQSISTYVLFERVLFLTKDGLKLALSSRACIKHTVLSKAKSRWLCFGLTIKVLAEDLQTFPFTAEFVLDFFDLGNTKWLPTIVGPSSDPTRERADELGDPESNGNSREWVCHGS